MSVDNSDKPVCVECGKVHLLCTGHKKHDRDEQGNKIPCGMPRIKTSRTGKCKQHGGMNPSGINSPHYKHGMRSRSVVSRGDNRTLLGGLGEIASKIDVDKLLSMSEDVLTIEAMIRQMLQEGVLSTSVECWRELRETVITIKESYDTKDSKALADGLNQLDRIIAKGHTATQSIDKFINLTNLKQKVVESERNYIFKKELHIPVLSVATFFDSLLNEIFTYVTDPRIQAKLRARFIALIGQQEQSELEAEDLSASGSEMLITADRID